MARLTRSAGRRPDPAQQFYNDLAEELIRKIEAGTAPWQQGWTDSPGRGLPVNLLTGKQYRGSNVLALEMMADTSGYSDHRWGTYKQIKEAGGQVRKGERSVKLVYWKFADERERSATPAVAETERAGEKPERLGTPPRAYPFYLFNAEQADGLPRRPEPEAQRWPPIEAAERALRASGARIVNDGGDRAYYDLRRDSIHLPAKTQFAEAASYYQAALHELGHWTGHPTRLNRETLTKGIVEGPYSKHYAREELRAEISSMIVGRSLNIGHDTARHASYVKHWVEALRDNSREVHHAAREAYQISDYVLGRARERDPELDKTLPPKIAPEPERAPEKATAPEPEKEPVQGRLFQGRPVPAAAAPRSRD